MSNAIITAVAALLAFAAMDDITSDHDANLTVERVAVALCLGWFAWMSWRFVAARRRWLGTVSVALLGAAVLAQRYIGPGQAPTLMSAHAVALLCLVWFLAVAGWLAVESRR